MDERKKLERQVRKNVDEINRIYTELFAEEYAKALEIALSHVIDDFYEDYMPTPHGPKYYERTYNLYNTYRTWVHRKGNDFFVSVYIGNEYMEPWYQDTVDYVYVGTIRMGIHGTKAIHVTNPAPLKKFKQLLRRRLPGIVQIQNACVARAIKIFAERRR